MDCCLLCWCYAQDQPRECACPFNTHALWDVCGLSFTNNGRGAGEAEGFGLQAAAAEVSAEALKAQLTKPTGWGPSEWGPIPFLPSPDVLVSRMEKQWGPLDEYRGISTTAKGDLPQLRSTILLIGEAMKY